jgi:hypothetical protein
MLAWQWGLTPLGVGQSTCPDARYCASAWQLVTTSVQQAFLANYQADAPCCQEIGAAIGGKSALLVTNRVRALVMLVGRAWLIKPCIR